MAVKINLRRSVRSFLERGKNLARKYSIPLLVGFAVSTVFEVCDLIFITFPGMPMILFGAFYYFFRTRQNPTLFNWRGYTACIIPGLYFTVLDWI